MFLARWLGRRNRPASDVIPGLRLGDSNGAGLVTGLAAVGVEDVEGEAIDAAVVHGEKDLAGTDGAGDASGGGDFAATRGDGEG